MVKEGGRRATALFLSTDKIFSSPWSVGKEGRRVIEREREGGIVGREGETRKNSQQTRRGGME